MLTIKLCLLLLLHFYLQGIYGQEISPDYDIYMNSTYVQQVDPTAILNNSRSRIECATWALQRHSASFAYNDITGSCLLGPSIAVLNSTNSLKYVRVPQENNYTNDNETVTTGNSPGNTSGCVDSESIEDAVLYVKIFNISKNFDDALKACLAMGGWLTELHHEENIISQLINYIVEISGSQELCSGSYWIGGRQLGQPGLANHNSWSWQKSHRPINTSNFELNDNGANLETALVLNVTTSDSFKFQDEDAQIKLCYICSC